MTIIISVSLMLFAGLCEIAARYLAWQWLRARWHPLSAIAALVMIVASLVAPVFQGGEFQFGRSTAAYGTLFVVMSLAWSWLIDRRVPDFFDILGAAFCIAGLSIMMYWPRKL